MDEKEVDVVRAQCGQSRVEYFARIIGPVESVVELAGDEDVAAVQPRVTNPLAN